jgi:hypothetical protein
MGPLFETRWQLTVTRLGILAFKIAIIVILILAVVTPVTGGVNIKMPELNDGVWSFDNGTMRLGTTVGVYNGGVFDVNDFHIDFGMTDANLTKLASAGTDHVNIRSGQWNDLDLKVAIDLNRMNETELRSFVFNVTKVRMALDVGATYPLGWISLNIGGNSTTEWQPLVKDYSVDVNHMSLVHNGGQYSLTVPYRVNVSDKISGAPMGLKVTMRNASGTMSTTDQTIVLQPETSGNLVLNLSTQAAQYMESHQEQIHFDAQASIMTASVNKSYEYLWKPPISDLGIGQPYLSPSLLVLVAPFHFNTSAPVTGTSMTITTTMTVNGAASGAGSTSVMAQPSNNVNIQIPISQSTLTNLQANPATLVFTVTMTSNDLTETQTVQYQWSP